MCSCFTRSTVFCCLCFKRLSVFSFVCCWVFIIISVFCLFFVNSCSRFSSADVEECIAAVRKLLESCLIILNELLYVNLQKPKHDKSVIKWLSLFWAILPENTEHYRRVPIDEETCGMCLELNLVSSHHERRYSQCCSKIQAARFCLRLVSDRWVKFQHEFYEPRHGCYFFYSSGSKLRGHDSQVYFVVET